MTKKHACPTAVALAEMTILPRDEAALLQSVYRAARKYFNVLRGVAVGKAPEARSKLFDLVEGGGDPAELQVAALIDGGSSSSCMDKQVVSERPEFKAPAKVAAGIIMSAPQPRRRTVRHPGR